MQLRDYRVALGNLQAAFAQGNDDQAVLVLEDLFDDGVTHGTAQALATLCDTRRLAEVWGVGIRRAQMYAKTLEQRGIGRRISGVYLLVEHDARLNAPGRPGNPNLITRVAGVPRSLHDPSEGEAAPERAI